MMPTIRDLETSMLISDLEVADCPLVHKFSEGVYLREITMPEGAVILGHEHTTRHMNIISKGACILLDIETGDRTELIAPCSFESKAGVRKLLYIVEECVWTTIHITTETDIETLESTLVIKSEVHKRIGG